MSKESGDEESGEEAQAGEKSIAARLGVAEGCWGLLFTSRHARARDTTIFS